MSDFKPLYNTGKLRPSWRVRLSDEIVVRPGVPPYTLNDPALEEIMMRIRERLANKRPVAPPAPSQGEDHAETR